MTHSYEDIIRLDGERTQGRWEAGVHPSNHRLNIIKPICFGKYVGKLPECEGGAVYFLHTANAQYIAAMPDTVGLLRKYREGLEKIIAEAIEHWPDAENWPIIEEMQQLLQEEQKG